MWCDVAKEKKSMKTSNSLFAWHLVPDRACLPLMYERTAIAISKKKVPEFGRRTDSVAKVVWSHILTDNIVLT